MPSRRRTGTESGSALSASRSFASASGNFSSSMSALISRRLVSVGRAAKLGFGRRFRQRNASATRGNRVRIRNSPSALHESVWARPSRTPNSIAGQPGPLLLRIFKGINLRLGDQTQDLLQVALGFPAAALNLVKFSHLFVGGGLITALFVNLGQAEVYGGVIGFEPLGSLKLLFGLLKIALRF